MEGVLLRAARDFVAASRDSPEAVRRVVDEVIRAAVRQIDTLAFFERCGEQLRCVYASGGRLEHFRGAILPVEGDSVAAQALRAGFRCTAHATPQTLHPADRCALAVPLVTDGAVTAVACAGTTARLAAEAIETIVAIVDHATPAYVLAIDRARDRDRATFDGLTGLLGPQSFRTRLRDALARAQHDPRARFALLFVDTDHFKDWNDTFGHASGDALLRRLADLLQAHAEGDDLAARNGGDEFCLVFGASEKSVAIERARALCAAIAAQPWEEIRPAESRAVIAITASIGVAAFPRDARSADALLEMADAAMYHSKRCGRNRVSYYGEDGAFVSTRALAGS